MKTNQLDIFCKINCSLIGIHVRSFTNCVYQCSCFLIIATFTFIFHLIRWQTIKQLLYLKMNLDRKKKRIERLFLVVSCLAYKKKTKGHVCRHGMAHGMNLRCQKSSVRSHSFATTTFFSRLCDKSLSRCVVYSSNIKLTLRFWYVQKNVFT